METNFGRNDPLTRKVWSRYTLIEAQRSSSVFKFIGSDPTKHIVVQVDDLEKSHGDSVRLSMLETIPETAVRGNETLTGKACELKFKYEDVCLDEIRSCPITFEKRMTAQRRPNQLRNHAKDQLSMWRAKLVDKSFFAHLAGYTPANGDPFLDANNEICEPSKQRHGFANCLTCDDDVAADESAVLTFDDIRRMKAFAKNQNSCDEGTFRPIMIDGREYYVLFIHDYQWLQLQEDPCYKEVQLAAMAGGDISNNPLFTGASGVWDGVLIHVTDRIPCGVSKETCMPLENVRRAVLVGAGAMTMAYGGTDGAKGQWDEEIFDYGKRQGIAMSLIYGMKRNRYAPEDACVRDKFNPRECEDYATLVFSSHVKGPKLWGERPPAAVAKTTSKKAAE